MSFLNKLKNMLNGEKTTSKPVANDNTDATNGNQEPQETITDKTEVDEKTQLIADNEVEVVTIKQKEKLITPKNDNRATKVPEKASNIEELKELTVVKVRNAIKKELKILEHSGVKIQELHFHFKNNRQDVHSVQAEKVFKEDEFLELIKADFNSNNIAYAQNFQIALTFQSPSFSEFSKITQQISVQILTPKEVFKQTQAKIKALSGVMHQEHYIIQPREKPYFIGRGEAPQLPSGRFIKNNIAFIEPDATNESLEINRNVSRSILLISYNYETNTFEIGRTDLMFNPNHVVKINRIENSGKQKEIKLNTTQIKVPLEDDDIIIINGKVTLSFELIHNN